MKKNIVILICILLSGQCYAGIEKVKLKINIYKANFMLDSDASFAKMDSVLVGSKKEAKKSLKQNFRKLSSSVSQIHLLDPDSIYFVEVCGAKQVYSLVSKQNFSQIEIPFQEKTSKEEIINKMTASITKSFGNVQDIPFRHKNNDCRGIIIPTGSVEETNPEVGLSIPHETLELLYYDKNDESIKSDVVKIIYIPFQ